VIASLVTPFRDDERIDYSSWQRVLETLAASGVGGILALGEEGEFRALSEEERMVALRFCRQTLPASIPLYGNVGSESTATSIRLAQAAEADGVNGLLVLAPHALITPREMAEHLTEIANSVRIPLMPVEGASAAANVAPKLVVELESARRHGRPEDAAKMERLLDPLEKLFRRHSYPAMIKEAMRMAGMPGGSCRRPIGPVPEDMVAALVSLIQDLRAGRWLPEPAAAASAGTAA
jgi:dihydrodipicolinate synthase/N-acetylneuraminate lyase